MTACYQLRESYKRHGARTTVAMLSEGLRTKKIHPGRFSFKDLAEAIMGHDWPRKMSRPGCLRYAHSEQDGPLRYFTEADIMRIPEGVTRGLREDSGDAIDVSAFANITGQIVYTYIHEGWEQAGMIGDELFRTQPTPFQTEKIPGVGRIVGEGRPIQPNQEYPELGFGEQYWQTPDTEKHGFIVALSKEVIAFDRTNLVTQRAGEIGKRLRLNKELRQLAVFAGVSVTINGETFDGNNHSWNGTSYNTYDTASNSIGINASTGVELIDWTDIEALLLLFADLRDPDTTRPILITPDTIVVQPYKLMTAKRIVAATEVRHGDITTGAGVQTIGSNPVAGDFKVLSSPLLYQLLQDSGIAAATSKNYWYLGQAKKGFVYMENYPLTTVQAPANSEAEFTRDVVMRWKASERGVPWAADPRYFCNGRA